MSYVQRAVDELRASGLYCAEKVEPSAISKIINMAEWDYYNIEIIQLESYLGMLAQQVYYIREESNRAEAREIELGNDFKMNALPYVLDTKIRSVEERWLFAASLTDELRLKFDLWQRAIIDAKLIDELAEPVVDKLNVLKKIYDDRRMEGRNKNLQKYVDGT